MHILSGALLKKKPHTRERRREDWRNTSARLTGEIILTTN